METTPPPQPDPDRDDVFDDAPTEDDLQDMEDDPARNPDDDRLKQVQGG
jgi:hypothetical protein